VDTKNEDQSIEQAVQAARESEIAMIKTTTVVFPVAATLRINSSCRPGNAR